MKCQYCKKEDGHLDGCPEIVTEMSKALAKKEFWAGKFSATFYPLKEDASDSYKLGFKMGWEDFADTPANC